MSNIEVGETAHRGVGTMSVTKGIGDDTVGDNQGRRSFGDAFDCTEKWDDERMLEQGDDPGQRDAAGPRMYTAGQVARVLGVAETTLRSWHRRYGVGPHARKAGGYRRYSTEDIARLEHMRNLITSGMLASDAARTVTGQVSAERLLAVRDRLAEASRQLDSRACRAIVTEAIQTFGVVTAWDSLCRPALLDVEAEQAAAAVPAACIPREHVLSWAITAALHGVIPLSPAQQRPAVMLACTDAEQHSLPLEALAAALAERHVPVRMLGAAVPTASLVDAVRATSPQVVVLWAQRPETANADFLRKLRRLPSRRLTAGPGWSARRRSSSDHVDSLLTALTTLSDSAL